MVKTTIKCILCAVACVAAAGRLVAAPASTLTLHFQATPAATVAGQINRTFNAHVVLEPGIDMQQRVTFTVSDTSGVAGRMNDVTYLAHALNADPRKVFVISKGSGAAPAIDNDSTMGFAHTKLSASQAIRMIAGTDNAGVNFHTNVGGIVKLSGPQLSVRQAAAEVARQTHTSWMAVYQLIPRNHQAVAGTIIGYTAGGQPITKLPNVGTRRSARYNHVSSRRATASVPGQVYSDPVSANVAPIAAAPSGPAAVQQVGPAESVTTPLANPYTVFPYDSYPVGPPNTNYLPGCETYQSSPGVTFGPYPGIGTLSSTGTGVYVLPGNAYDTGTPLVIH
jgi:hypothetical protein